MKMIDGNEEDVSWFDKMLELFCYCDDNWDIYFKIL